jgi:RNA polymerase sigma factor for flagellar operon FliA
MSAAVRSYQDVAVRDRRDALILEHLSVVRHVVGRLLAELPPSLDSENLEAAGMLGLVEAARHFDPNRGVDFRAYAQSRIRGAVLDELRRNCPLPQRVLERVSRIRKAHQELPPPVTIEALARATGFSREDVVDCLGAIRITQMVSWDGLGEPIDTRPDGGIESPDSAVEREERQRVLQKAIAQLPERDRIIVTLYFLEDLRLKEIGQVLKLSESRVSRVLNEALLQLGEYLRARGL